MIESSISAHPEREASPRLPDRARLKRLETLLCPCEGVEGVGCEAKGLEVLSNTATFHAFATQDEVAPRDLWLARARRLAALDAQARQEGIGLRELACRRAPVLRKALLGAWAAILNDPSLKRKAMAAHQAAKFLRPLAGALAAFGDAVTVTPVSAAELGSVDGARVLDDRLTNERARLDARGSTAHVVATGYPGSAQASRRLSEVCHRNRAFLWLDAPALRTLQEIRAAAAGGVLEGMGGTGDANRWKAACAIRVRTSRGVVADGVRLSEDTYISASSAIASAWLQSIAEGRRGEPVSGYASPLDESVDGVEVDLPLDPDENSGYRLLAEAGFIVAVLPSPGSRSVVLAGANTMQPGMQLLPALNELSAVRIAEEAIGRLSMFQGLDASRERVDDSVSQWLHERTGPGEMFRSGSTVTTIADHANNQIVVEYVLIQQSVTERAVIRIRNTAGAKKNGAVEWERTDG